MNILDDILASKRKELDLHRRQIPLSELERKAGEAGPCRSLKAALLDPSATGIIAEFKRKSPSRGWIHQEAGAGTIARSYAAHGASAMSVLTDLPYFGGSPKDLAEARSSCGIPVLRKDFIIDPYQIYESRVMGADAILLIASCLDAVTVRTLALLSRSLGMETLLEVHRAGELEKLDEAVTLVGVNNRDLTSFRVDIRLSLELSGQIPRSRVKVTESGISDPAAAWSLIQAGYQGLLIGETFMRDPDPGACLGSFVQELEQQKLKV